MSKTWRPFCDSSVWNTKLPTEPELDPRSDERMAFFLKSTDGDKFWVSIDEWSIPVFEVDEHRTPWRKVSYTERTKKQHPKLLQEAPVPVEAVPDPLRDAHLCIINESRTRAWDFWAVREYREALVVSSAVEWDLTGPGYGEPGGGGCRAAGFPLIAGLIRHEEIMAGRIDHALCFACTICAANEYVYPPATETDGQCRDPRALPEGVRFQLDPKLDLSALDLKPAAGVIARALQEYGMFLGDVSGGFGLYAENFIGKPKNLWEGILGNEDLRPVPTSRLRILRMPPVRKYDYT